MNQSLLLLRDALDGTPSPAFLPTCPELIIPSDSCYRVCNTTAHRLKHIWKSRGDSLANPSKRSFGHSFFYVSDISVAGVVEFCPYNPHGYSIPRQIRSGLADDLEVCNSIFVKFTTVIRCMLQNVTMFGSFSEFCHRSLVTRTPQSIATPQSTTKTCSHY